MIPSFTPEEQSQIHTHESKHRGWAARDAAWAAWDASWDASKWEVPRSPAQDAEWFAARRAAKAARSAAWSQAWIARDNVPSAPTQFATQ